MDIHSKVPNQAFRDNFDAIFGKKEQVHSTGGPGTGNVVITAADIRAVVEIPVGREEDILVGTIMPFDGKLQQKTADGWNVIANLLPGEEEEVRRSMQGR